MAHFLSCDWGTSSFRLRLISKADLSVVASISNGNGCAVLNEKFKQSGIGKSDRQKFYCDFLQGAITELSGKSAVNLDNLPLLISGMASSTIGMINLPYKMLPVNADGSELEIQILTGLNLSNPTAVISGLRTADDVMRGEETKLIGCLGKIENDDQLIVMPGTHPKHAVIKSGKIETFNTFMTGEFFDLLTHNSLLAQSVASGEFDASAFKAGVIAGAKENLLNISFRVRTNSLFEKYSPEKNYHFLSGILIGHELRSINNLELPLTLLSDTNLGELYKTALEVLGIRISKIMDADLALIKGQKLISDILF